MFACYISPSFYLVCFFVYQSDSYSHHTVGPCFYLLRQALPYNYFHLFTFNYIYCLAYVYHFATTFLFLSSDFCFLSLLSAFFCPNCIVFSVSFYFLYCITGYDSLFFHFCVTVLCLMIFTFNVLHCTFR